MLLTDLARGFDAKYPKVSVILPAWLAMWLLVWFIETLVPVWPIWVSIGVFFTLVLLFSWLIIRAVCRLTGGC